MLQFNSKGLLTPNSNIKSTIEEFESEFVIMFNNQRRHEIVIDLEKNWRKGSWKLFIKFVI